MSRLWEEYWPYILAVVGVGVLIFALVMAYRQKLQCEAGGGHLEQRNCQTFWQPMSCGSGCTVIVPQTYCDSVCVGARAEAMP